MSYDTVAAAIRFLKDNARSQPTLKEVAEHVGLSEFHLQRVFTAWAGISPKRFLQFLTVEHARKALRSSSDVLGAALDAGLSGPGRLHDLMVACDAMTPGEVRAGGAGLAIKSGRAASPFGNVVAGVTARGVCWLQFDDDDRALRAAFPHARFERDDDEAAGVVARTLAGARSPLHVRGTNFQIQVWQALIRVPPGAVISYSGLARAAGKPSAQRAVGSALAKNDVALLIPCHRVIRGDGDVGQYRWGSERKQALLAWEAAAAAAE